MKKSKNKKQDKSEKKDYKKSNPTPKSNFQLPRPKLNIKEETKHAIFAVVSFFLALFFMLSAFGIAGRAGEFFYRNFSILFGVGYFLVPILFLLLGISFVQSVRPNISGTHIFSSLLFLFSSLGIVDIVSDSFGQVPAMRGGGILGNLISRPFISLFDVYASIILLGAFLLISLFILFDARPNLLPLVRKLFSFLKGLFTKKENEEEEEEYDEEETCPPEEDQSATEKIKEEKTKAKEEPKTKKFEEEKFEVATNKKHSNYVFPPLSLLEGDRGKPNVGDVKANLNIIKRTLLNFGIEVEMDEVTIGPSVTRYALKPAEGVKISRILGLQDDLSLALAAHPIRIEAPIPGKSLVGIEIPNRVKSTVGLATLLADPKFGESTKPLFTALGKNISGNSFFGNIAKMPHLLIAGATGSGKSVTIHSIITSLLYRNGPEELRFIMIDPKRVELTLYNKIPHLLTPVITEPKKAILSLKWAAKEMERRYEVLEKNSVRDISSYHSTILEGAKAKKDSEGDVEIERMPYIVIIIDELADIMSAYPRELESAIVRLAQMSRAVGIHLILSTQRPSVNVITGLIKANIPARLALQVSSQIDSRTILDEGGAEKLLGAGDMLYASGEMSQPERLQSAFISETELKKVVKFITDHNDDVSLELSLEGNIGTDKTIFSSTLKDGIDFSDSGLEDSNDDELYEEAREAVFQAKKASTSYLQRKLKVGYSRAARLIDMLEERGVVGPADGAKPREILEVMPENAGTPIEEIEIE